MIWDDPNFKAIYTRELNQAVLALEHEARTVEQKFHTDAGRAGMVSGVHLAYAAGNIASITLYGYVNKAIDIFESTVNTLEATVTEDDLNELRRRIAVDLERRETTLSDRLGSLLKRDAGGAIWKSISTQSPANAKGLLARRIENDLAVLRFKSRAAAGGSKRIFISHSTKDATLALALCDALKEHLGDGVDVFVSSDLRNIAGGADTYAVIVEAARTSPIMLAVATPNFLGERWLDMETFGADCAGNLVIPCIARGTTFERLRTTPTLHRGQGRDLRRPEHIAALFADVRGKLDVNAKEDSPAIDDLIRAARRPALTGVSELAWRVCEAVSVRFETADERKGEWVEAAKLTGELDVNAEDLEVTVAELVDRGWFKRNGITLGTDGMRLKWFHPVDRFFLDTEEGLGGPSPWDDARALARKAVRSKDPAPGVGSLADSLEWSVRRTNLALYAIAADDPDNRLANPRDRLGEHVATHLKVSGKLLLLARHEG